MAHAPIRESPPEVEQRTTHTPVRLRAAGGGQGRTIGGYGAVFDAPSEPLPFIEVVDRRFFNKAKSDGWVGAICRYQHSDLALLGSVAADSLRLDVDSTGLQYECDLPNTGAGGDVAALTARGDLAYSSMAFQVYDDSWDYQDGQPQRRLLSGRLIDVSPVSQPAYRSTSCALRSLAEAKGISYADVVEYAERDQLAKFFVRSDRSSRPMSGRDAVLETLRRRWPAKERPPMSLRQRQIQLLGKRWPPQERPPMSLRQRQIQLLKKKVGSR
jgi:uncharacterized protein